MTASTAPTRDDLHRAIMLGLLAAWQGRPVSSCRFPADTDLWNAQMRAAWLDGYTAGAKLE